MTDEEIIKALECCVAIKCKECPVRHHCSSKAGGIDLSDVLNLINRKRAEIEQKDTEIDILVRKTETLKDEILELRTEIERLKTMHSEMCIGLEVIKKNAYKQFGKFLIDKSKKGILYAADIPDYVLEMER